MTRCEDCERLEAKLSRADRKIIELTGESNRLGNMAVAFGSQNGVFRNQARDLRVERDDLREEVERLRSALQKVRSLAGAMSKWPDVIDIKACEAKINKLVDEALKGGEG